MRHICVGLQMNSHSKKREAICKPHRSAPSLTFPLVSIREIRVFNGTGFSFSCRHTSHASHPSHSQLLRLRSSYTGEK